MPDPIWFFSGQLEPDFHQWKFFDQSAITSPETLLRINFAAIDGGELKPIYSYLLLSRVWINFSPVHIEPAKKIYVDSSPIVIADPIPQAFLDRGFIVAEYRCRKAFRRRWYGKEEVRYSVALEWS